MAVKEFILSLLANSPNYKVDVENGDITSGASRVSLLSQLSKLEDVHKLSRTSSDENAQDTRKDNE